MKNNFIKICLLCSLIVPLTVGCKKSVETKPAKGDLKIELLGSLIPSFVELDKNSIATVRFVGSDQNYRFDLNRIDANSFYGLIKNAQKNSTPVKVYVTKQTEIVRVE
jgi:hypothetical protein